MYAYKTNWKCRRISICTILNLATARLVWNPNDLRRLLHDIKTKQILIMALRVIDNDVKRVAALYTKKIEVKTTLIIS